MCMRVCWEDKRKILCHPTHVCTDEHLLSAGPQEDAGIPGCCFAYITRKLVSVSTRVRLSDCAFALS